MAKVGDHKLDLDGGERGAAKDLWFRLDDKEAGPEMVRIAKLIESSQVPREDQMLRQARVYANQWLGSLYDLATARSDRKTAPWNACADAVSTAQSMVCRSPVNVTLETSGTEHGAQRLARDATRWLYGVWSENKIAAEVAPGCFLDAGVVDVGIPIVRVVDKRIRIEKAFPSDVIVSEAEAINGRPFQMFYRPLLPRHSVMERYGTDDEKREAIRGVRSSNSSFSFGHQADMIHVYEGWSIQGKHVVAVDGCFLWGEPWKHDFLPTTPMYVDRPIAGWFGRGYVQQLLGYQIQLYLLNDAIEEHLRLLAAAKWILEAGCGIDPDDLDNEIGGILTKARGAADPRLLVPEPVPKDLLNERQVVYDTALQSVGLNTWAVAGQEPASRSGIAMEVARDKERGRLLTAGSNYEQWHVDLAHICFALGDQTSGQEYSGRGPADKELGAVDFAKISKFLKEYPWRIKPFPISALPEAPDARRKTVEGWMESGLITGPVALSLLELPDVDAEASLMSAAREEILWQIEQILDKGRAGYNGPEPDQDLALAKRYFTAARRKGRRQGVAEDRLDLLARWVAEADALEAPEAAPEAVEVRAGVGAAPVAAIQQQQMAAAPPPGAEVPVPEAIPADLEAPMPVEEVALPAGDPTSEPL